jgi:hypothetical protein
MVLRDSKGQWFIQPYRKNNPSFLYEALAGRWNQRNTKRKHRKRWQFTTLEQTRSLYGLDIMIAFHADNTELGTIQKI